MDTTYNYAEVSARHLNRESNNVITARNNNVATCNYYTSTILKDIETPPQRKVVEVQYEDPEFYTQNHIDDYLESEEHRFAAETEYDQYRYYKPRREAEKKEQKDKAYMRMFSNTSLLGTHWEFGFQIDFSNPAEVARYLTYLDTYLKRLKRPQAIGDLINFAHKILHDKKHRQICYALIASKGNLQAKILLAAYRRNSSLLEKRLAEERSLKKRKENQTLKEEAEEAIEIEQVRALLTVSAFMQVAIYLYEKVDRFMVRPCKNAMRKIARGYRKVKEVSDATTKLLEPIEGIITKVSDAIEKVWGWFGYLKEKILTFFGKIKGTATWIWQNFAAGLAAIISFQYAKTFTTCASKVRDFIIEKCGWTSEDHNDDEISDIIIARRNVILDLADECEREIPEELHIPLEYGFHEEMVETIAEAKMIHAQEREQRIITLVDKKKKDKIENQAGTEKKEKEEEIEKHVKEIAHMLEFKDPGKEAMSFMGKTCFSLKNFNSYCGEIPKFVNIARAIEWIVSNIKKLIEWIQDCIAGEPRPRSKLEIAIVEYEKNLEDVDLMWRDSDMLHTTKLAQGIEALDLKSREINRIALQHTSVIRPIFSTKWATASVKTKSMINDYKIKKKSGVARADPVWLYIQGPPGCGKTHMLKEIFANVIAYVKEFGNNIVTDIPADIYQTVYNYNQGETYHDGYNGQFYVQIDDFGQATDATKRGELAAALINMCAPTPFSLLVADPQKKSGVWFKSRCIVSTTNITKRFNVGNFGLTDPSALETRRTVHIEVVPSESGNFEENTYNLLYLEPKHTDYTKMPITMLDIIQLTGQAIIAKELMVHRPVETHKFTKKDYSAFPLNRCQLPPFKERKDKEKEKEHEVRNQAGSDGEEEEGESELLESMHVVQQTFKELAETSRTEMANLVNIFFPKRDMKYRPKIKNFELFDRRWNAYWYGSKATKKEHFQDVTKYLPYLLHMPSRDSLRSANENFRAAQQVKDRILQRVGEEYPGPKFNEYRKRFKRYTGDTLKLPKNFYKWSYSYVNALIEDITIKKDFFGKKEVIAFWDKWGNEVVAYLDIVKCAQDIFKKQNERMSAAGKFMTIAAVGSLVGVGLACLFKMFMPASAHDQNQIAYDSGAPKKVAKKYMNRAARRKLARDGRFGKISNQVSAEFDIIGTNYDEIAVRQMKEKEFNEEELHRADAVCWILWIKEDYAVFPAHAFTTFYKEGNHILIEFTGARSQKKYYWLEDLEVRQLTGDLVCVRFKGATMRRNIIPHFADEIPTVGQVERLLPIKGSTRLMTEMASSFDNKLHKVVDDKADPYEADLRFYSMRNERGNCGAVYVSRKSGKIFGMHTAGCPSIDVSYGCSMIKSDFDFLNTTENQIGQILDPIPYDITPCDPLEGVVTMGQVEKKYGVYIPSKTNLKISPMDKETFPFPETTDRPAPLQPFINKHGEKISPVRVALGKLVKQRRVDPGPLPQVNYERVLPRNYRRDNIRDMTLEEAIYGIPGIYSGVDFTKSGGYILKKWGRTREELCWAWVEDEGSRKRIPRVHPILRRAVEQKIEYMKEGKIHPAIYEETLKDEIRPADKCDAGNTRLFASQDFVSILVSAMFFGLWQQEVMKDPTGSPIALKINPHSHQGAEFYARHAHHVSNIPCPAEKQGKRTIGAEDANTYDYSIKMEAQWEFEKFAAATHPQWDPFHRRVLLMNFIAYHIIGTFVFWRESGTSSGSFFTSLFNSFVNWWLHEVAFLSLYGEEWVDDLVDSFCGDDTFWSVSEACKDYTMDYIRKFMWDRFRMTFTSCSKDDRSNLTWEDATFLKRRFVTGHLGIMMPLAPESIANMIKWTTTDCGPSEWKSTLDSALLEAFHYGEEKYNDVLRWCHKEQLRLNLPGVFKSWAVILEERKKDYVIAY